MLRQGLPAQGKSFIFRRLVSYDWVVMRHRGADFGVRLVGSSPEVSVR
jgi:hypothetical protein